MGGMKSASKGNCGDTRQEGSTPSSEDGADLAGKPEPDKEMRHRRHPMFGALKGTFTIDPDWDLTQPAMPEWADLIDELYGPEKRN